MTTEMERLTAEGVIFSKDPFHHMYMASFDIQSAKRLVKEDNFDVHTRVEILVKLESARKNIQLSEEVAESKND